MVVFSSSFRRLKLLCGCVCIWPFPDSRVYWMYWMTSPDFPGPTWKPHPPIDLHAVERNYWQPFPGSLGLEARFRKPLAVGSSMQLSFTLSLLQKLLIFCASGRSSLISKTKLITPFLNAPKVNDSPLWILYTYTCFSYFAYSCYTCMCY